MSNENQGTSLATEPIGNAGASEPTGKSKRPKAAGRQISKAVTSGKSKGKSFNEGDLVLFHVKHLHGLHGSIVMKAGQGQYVVRGNEAAIEGQLFQFSAEQLEPCPPTSLDLHHSDRLDWDYPE